eukprot:768481-Hanusia_phi.AAC.1
MVGKAWKCSDRWNGGGRWQKRMMIFDLGTGELMWSKDGGQKKKVLGIFPVGKNLTEKENVLTQNAKFISLLDVKEVLETSEEDEPVAGAGVTIRRKTRSNSASPTPRRKNSGSKRLSNGETREQGLATLID